MKTLLLICLTAMMISCAVKKDEHYYQSHPEKLQEALNHCPKKQPEHLTCQQLKDVAMRFNQLANELHANPQEFGKKIITLQEEIARQKAQLKKDSTQKELKEKLAENQEMLDSRLTLVKLFESPEG